MSATASRNSQSLLHNMKKNVLVTGAAGFIGSHVAEHCLKLGMNVVAVDDLSGGFLENVPRQATFVNVDLKDPGKVTEIAKHGPFDYIYHLAAYAAEGLSHYIRRYNYETNLLASVNLLNYAVNTGAKCFVFTSSIAVYGKNQLPMTEDMVPQPEDPYGVSKYAFELDLKAAHEIFGLNYIIFRPHNVYGERQNIADKYRNVIGIFMNQVLQGKPMSIFGNGLQTRAFSYIDDVAPVIARGPESPEAYCGVYNIGAETPYTVLDLSKLVAKTFGVKHETIYLPARNEVIHAFSSNDKVAKAFNTPKPVTLADGIARMAAWAQTKGPMTTVRFGAVEIEKNLPPSWR